METPTNASDRDLVASILIWWTKHQYDEDNGHNRYDNLPNFVRIALERAREFYPELITSELYDWPTWFPISKSV